jgi:hypothetical protein
MTMLGSYARAAMLGLLLLGGAGAARGDELADFNGAIEAVEAHNRVAAGYLRNGNADLASVEIDRLRQAWSKVGSIKRPAVFDGKLYVAMLTDVSLRLVTADLMLNSGRLDNTRQALDAVRTDFYNLRKSAGIVVLADCIRDSSAAMEALMAYNDRELDWAKPETAAGVGAASAAYGKVLDRCNATAGDTIRKEPEFRRLIDGAKEGLALVPQAIKERDTAMLQRVLIQLRSFDNLLEFRFG